MPNFYPLMTCLYECIYRCMQALGRTDALEIITSPIGFSIEAHIASRAWLLCGQSDIDYYQPQLNRGIRAQWMAITPQALCKHFETTKDEPPKPLIIETDAKQITYYKPGVLGTGMPHAFIIFNNDVQQSAFQIFDRLAPDTLFKKEDALCWIPAQQLKAAFHTKLFHLQYEMAETQLTWAQECTALLERSIHNLRRQVDRLQANFQVLGLAGLQALKETLLNFPVHYQEDTQSLWLMNHYLPVNILQSVYGNRFFFKKALEALPELEAEPLISALEMVLTSWKLFRRQCNLCANGALSYRDLAQTVDRIIHHETHLLTHLENKRDELGCHSAI